MNAYAILMVVIVLLRALFSGEENKNRFTKIAFFSLFIIYGLRSALNIGYDSTSSYYAQFTKAPVAGVSFHESNIGYQVLNYLGYYATGKQYQIFIIVISIFVSYSFYRLVKEYSDNPFISIMWFVGMLYYIFMFSALKQSIAMAVLCYAFDAIFNRKLKRYLILIIIAALFHFPAIIFLPAYWIYKMRIGKYYLLLLGAILITVFLFRSQIVSVLGNMYGNETSDYENMSVQFLGTKSIIMILIIVIALWLHFPSEDEKVYSTLISFMGIAAVIQTFCYYNNTFERLADYYYVFSILFMPMLFGSNKQNENQSVGVIENYTIGLATNIGITIFSIWRFLSYIELNASFFLPYLFFWQKQ